MICVFCYLICQINKAYWEDIDPALRSKAITKLSDTWFVGYALYKSSYVLILLKFGCSCDIDTTTFPQPIKTVIKT